MGLGFQLIAAERDATATNHLALSYVSFTETTYISDWTFSH